MGEDTSSKSNMGEHNGSQVALILVNSILFATAASLVHLWAVPEFAADLFLNSFRNLTLSYEIPVTPDHWVDILWPIIFAWLFISKVFTWITLCRKNPVGPLYKSPPVIGALFLFCYSIALFCLIAWTIVYDRDEIIAATVLMWTAAIFCWFATASLYYNVHEYGAWMARHMKPSLWAYRLLWHNAMAAITTWLSVQAIYALAITLRVEVGISLQTTVYIVLGSISGVMLLWFVLENTVADRFGRYTVTPYFVIITLMVGVFTRHYKKNNSDESDYFIVSLLGAAVFCAVLRIVLVIARGVKCPLYRDNKVGEDPVSSFGGE